jgi:hypothetical protein
MSGPPLSAVDRLLGFVDRPWKLVAVVVLVVTGIAGVIGWEERAAIAEAVLHGLVKPRLETGRFTSIFANRLMTETSADLAVLASISLHDNLIRDIDGYRRGEAGWRPPVNPRPLFYAVRDPLLLVGLMEGKPICRDIGADGGASEERMLAELGMRRRCYVAVPPVLDALVGGLMLAWKVPLDPEVERGAQSVMYQAAAELATW